MATDVSMDMTWIILDKASEISEIFNTETPRKAANRKVNHHLRIGFSNPFHFIICVREDKAMHEW